MTQSRFSERVALWRGEFFWSQAGVSRSPPRVKQTVALFGAVFLLGCGDSEGAGGGGTGTQSSSGQTTSAAMTTGSTTSTGAGGDGGGPPVTALEHLVGRFDESDPAGPTATWPGTSYLTRIDGTELSIDLEGPAGLYFQVVVDGVPTEVFRTEVGASPYVVASGLPSGLHDVLVYRRVEGFFGAAQFRGFVPGPATTQVESASPYVHRIEFIGDSITCGYGVEGPNATCNFSGATESAYETYAAIASRNVSAAAHLIAYSGKGVFQNYGGDLNEPMPVLYQRTLTNDATPRGTSASSRPRPSSSTSGPTTSPPRSRRWTSSGLTSTCWARSAIATRTRRSSV